MYASNGVTGRSRPPLGARIYAISAWIMHSVAAAGTLSSRRPGFERRLTRARLARKGVYLLVERDRSSSYAFTHSVYFPMTQRGSHHVIPKPTGCGSHGDCLRSN